LSVTVVDIEQKQESRAIMASPVNIYSQLLISTIRIADIRNSNCWYRHL